MGTDRRLLTRGTRRAVGLGVGHHRRDLDGGAIGADDIGEQTREALRRIAAALQQVGARLDHVVRTGCS